MARTITFQPSKDLSDFIDGLVQTGSYNNQSEVVREGLRLLQEKNARSKLQELRRLIDEGENSGKLATWSADDFLKKLKKKTHG
jgi:antitoxin ParD1/3/4